MIVPAVILMAGLSVHEWGVVLVSEGQTGFVSAPEAGITRVFDVKAPVLYFHGDPCTVNVRVTVPSGLVTLALPEPASGGVGSDSVHWANLSLVDTVERNPWPGITSWEWGETWSDVQALSIRRSPFVDRYLFYECSLVGPGFLPYFVDGNSPAVGSGFGDLPCILLRGGTEDAEFAEMSLRNLAEGAPPSWEPVVTASQVRIIVESWAAGVLEPDEFNALWNTWETTFLFGTGSCVHVLYSIPESVMSGVAPIEITCDDGQTAEVKRFHLAFVPAGNP